MLFGALFLVQREFDRMLSDPRLLVGVPEHTLARISAVRAALGALLISIDYPPTVARELDALAAGDVSAFDRMMAVLPPDKSPTSLAAARQYMESNAWVLKAVDDALVPLVPLLREVNPTLVPLL